jgi:hypothetical protein
VFDYIDGDDTVRERESPEGLAKPVDGLLVYVFLEMYGYLA